MKRILVAVPILVLLLALSSSASLWFGIRPPSLPKAAGVLLWAIEAFGLAGLFLIARGPLDGRSSTGQSLGQGLAVGLAAWIFRGPVVSTTLLAAGVYGRSEARMLSVVTLVTFLACGLVLGWFGRPQDSAG